jgi:hypothetical protein
MLAGISVEYYLRLERLRAHLSVKPGRVPMWVAGMGSAACVIPEWASFTSTTISSAFRTFHIAKGSTLSCIGPSRAAIRPGLWRNCGPCRLRPFVSRTFHSGCVVISSHALNSLCSRRLWSRLARHLVMVIASRPLPARLACTSGSTPLRDDSPIWLGQYTGMSYPSLNKDSCDAGRLNGLAIRRLRPQ